MLILVTGGAGYIGSHAARALAKSGHTVRIFDNLSTGHRSLANGFELIVGDLRDIQKLSLVLRGVDAVMHFAANAYVGESVDEPRKYFDNNVQAGLTLLNAVVDARIPYFIFSSSCAVYGIPFQIPITEDTPCQPISPYGVSKLFIEQALEAYNKAYGLRFVSLRYFNAAGASEGVEIGELHHPETHLIPRALRVAADLEAALEIHGYDYDTPDGTCVRDYLHVSDIGEAHVKALEYLTSGGESAALNLGTGRGYSIEEVIQSVEGVVGGKLRVEYRPRRPGDPPILVANPARAEQLLNWKASRSLLQMVSSAWNWLNRSRTSQAFEAEKGMVR